MLIFPRSLDTQNDESPADSTNSADGGAAGAAADAPSRQAVSASGTHSTSSGTRHETGSEWRMRDKYTFDAARACGAKAANATPAETLSFVIPSS